MKRLRVLDCYTRGYSATILKAFGARTEVIPLYSVNAWFDFEEKYSEVPPNLENTPLNTFLDTHILVSLPELYALSDPQKIRDINSVTVEYISAYAENKPKFKKVQLPTETTYELPGVGYFEKLSSNIHRYFGRLNGGALILCEVCLWYDVLTKKDSLELYNTYKDQIGKVPQGDVIGVYDEIFPSLILCENKQVLKLRKRRKCLQIPQFNTLSKEEKFCRTLLFYPLRPGQSIDTDRIGENKNLHVFIFNISLKMITSMIRILLLRMAITRL